MVVVTLATPGVGMAHPTRAEEDPVPTPTDDRRDLLTVIAHMRAKPGKEEELRSALQALVEPTTKEKG